MKERTYTIRGVRPLVMHNEQSQLCTSCHQVGTTTVTAHTNCNACHQTHTAPRLSTTVQLFTQAAAGIGPWW